MEKPTTLGRDDIQAHKLHGTCEYFKPETAKQRELYALWLEKRGDRAMPSRQDFDPTEIPHLLPNIVLFDVYRDPADFRYRLIGSAADRFHTAPHTGLRFSEIPGKGQGSEVWKHFRYVAETGQPSSKALPYVGPKSIFVRMSITVLPLSDDGKNVNMLISLAEFHKT